MRPGAEAADRAVQPPPWLYRPLSPLPCRAHAHPRHPPCLADNLDHWRVNLTFDPVAFEDPGLGVRVHRGVYESAALLYDAFLPMARRRAGPPRRGPALTCLPARRAAPSAPAALGCPGPGPPPHTLTHPPSPAAG